MKRHFLILIILAVALTGFLFSRPKVVVKDEAKANRDKPTAQNSTAKSEDNHDEDSHTMKLSAELQKKVDDFKKQLVNAKDNAQKGKLLTEIAEVFAQGGRVDSAAKYIEQIAVAEPTPANWKKAGDTYFQAFNLALRQENMSSLAEKTRFCYQKVLDTNPRDLSAKTNVAMTYVGSETPMQAIMTLREVLEEDPNYVPALMNLGVLSMQSNQYDKAMERFRSVLRIDPNNINAEFGLGYSLIELDRKDDARKVFQDLKTKVKEPTLVEEVNKTLESLK
ncbi:MAG: tetratricopeptide repeat protein [Spirosomataceae bacterium]